MNELDEAIQQAIANLDEPKEEAVIPDDSNSVESEETEVKTEVEETETETDSEVTEEAEIEQTDEKLVPLSALIKERETARYYRELAEFKTNLEPEVESEITEYNDVVLDKIQSRLEYLELIDLTELNELDSQKILWEIEDYQDKIENRKIEIANKEQELIRTQQSIAETFTGFVKSNALDEGQAETLKAIAIYKYGKLEKVEDALTKALGDMNISKAKELPKNNPVLDARQKVLQQSTIAPKGTMVVEEARTLDDAINLAMKNLNIN